MSFLRGWTRSAAPAVSSLSPQYEIDSLQDAQLATKLIMEDKYEEAAKSLSEASSPFHKFLLSICYFQRAVLGTEPETIKASLPILADAEQLIVDFHTRALQDTTLTHSSDIYPAGTVYSMMQAEVQFMYAITAVMNASFTDAIRALMKIRKGYATLQQIFELEQTYARSRGPQRQNSDTSSLKKTNSRRSFEYRVEDDASEFSEWTSHPVDAFIHAGLCYNYGVLMWALSIVPPPFDKILSFMSYRGDRQLGHSLMWEASKHPKEIHGARSSYTTLIIYNGIAARCNIRTPDAIPHDKVQALLDTLIKLYPGSHKWAVQQAIIYSVHDRQLEKAREILLPGTQDEGALKFIRALSLFERGCKSLWLHDYDASAAAFIDIAKYTDWSYSLFHYIAGISYTAAYRRVLHKNEPSAASDYATKANEALGKVMGEVCKRKVLGKPVPIEIYIRSNMNRWLARAAAEQCPLVEAVDVAPSEELMWLFGGYEQMAESQLQESLETLEFYRTRTDEERARKALFRAACLRNLGKIDESILELDKYVLCHTAVTEKTWDKHASNWILPVAHYDMAVCLWQQAYPEMTDKAKLQLCAEHVRAASKWAGHDLQTIMGIQIGAAIDALKKIGIQV